MFSSNSLIEEMHGYSELANFFVNIILLIDEEFQNVAATFDSALCMNQWESYVVEIQLDYILFLILIEKGITLIS